MEELVLLFPLHYLEMPESTNFEALYKFRRLILEYPYSDNSESNFD